MSSPLDLRIGTSATDEKKPAWPKYDHEGREYIKNGIATVNLGHGKFAVIGANRNPDKELIKALKERAAGGHVEEYETKPQDFSGVELTPTPEPPSVAFGTTVADDTTTSIPRSPRRGNSQE
jgi:hypothetical protein